MLRHFRRSADAPGEHSRGSLKRVGTSIAALNSMSRTTKDDTAKDGTTTDDTTKDGICTPPNEELTLRPSVRQAAEVRTSTTHRLLPTTYYLLPTTYYLLLDYLLPTTCC